MAMKVRIWGARGSLPAPLAPTTLEARFKGLLEEFFDAGHSAKPDIEKFISSLPIHRLGGYGGNTPCVEILAGSGDSTQQIIIDGGSGIRNLGYELMKGPCGKGQGE